jgi:hypothetical protein
MKTAVQLKALVDQLVTTGLHSKTFENIDINPRSFIRDGVVVVSAEDGPYWADYYGEFRGGYPWINPKLEEFATAQGGHWEWDNPGSISFYLD